MTRSHNSRRGSEAVTRPYAGSYVQPKTRTQRHTRLDLDLDDLDFDDRWEEAKCAEAEADSGEEQLWIALSATPATQLPSDPCSDDWDAASEWTLVSAAESSWVVEWEADVAQPAAVLAPWPEEGVSDAAIAAQLQDDERTSAGIGTFVISRRAFGRRHPTRVPVGGLVARMGVCVVCSESVATVIMEPCGHLALCGSCSEGWTRSTCVLCRCPCARIHLLSVDEGVYESVGVNVQLADGLVTIPSIERSIAQCNGPAHSNTKLERRQARHRYSRERRQKRPHARGSASAAHVSRGDPTLAGGLRGKQALQAQVDEAWERWHQECARWRQERNACRAVLRETPHPWRGQVRRYSSFDQIRRYLFASVRGSHRSVVELIAQATAPRPDFGHVYHQARSRLFCSNIRFDQKLRSCCPHSGQKQKQQEVLRQEMLRKKEMRRQERKEMEARKMEMEAMALLAATEVAAVAARLLQEPLECAACGQGEACMMHLPCRHVALCQRCFDTTWQSNAPCARCGTASHISLCVRRA
tara:strand:- start:147 stop:1730 length:1584 start_codon:yes stop_codon:yes gene_type:complete